MSIEPVTFKLSRSATEIAERMNVLQQDLRAAFTASGSNAKFYAYWVDYRGECRIRIEVLSGQYNPDEIDRVVHYVRANPAEDIDFDRYCGELYDDSFDRFRYAALAESLWLYGCKDKALVQPCGSSYTTESYK